jgi:hypothetical protein
MVMWPLSGLIGGLSAREVDGYDAPLRHKELERSVYRGQADARDLFPCKA